MDKCLPLVQKSQAEILILLSNKNIDIDESNNPNTITGKSHIKYFATK